MRKLPTFNQGDRVHWKGTPSVGVVYLANQHEGRYAVRFEGGATIVIGTLGLAKA